jgi:hypothetical protein
MPIFSVWIGNAGYLYSPASGGQSRRNHGWNSWKNVKFRDVVLKSVHHVLSLLASEGISYPSVVVTGGAAILLDEPRLEGVYCTGDVDISTDFSTDIEEVFLTLEELEHKHPDRIFVIGVGGVVRFASLEEGILPVDFIYPREAKLQEIFRYAHQNATSILASLHIGKKATTVRIARLEDALLCKLAVHRKKDLEGLEQIIPKLEELGRIDWQYLSNLAKRFGLGKEITALREKVLTPRVNA